MRRHPYLFFFVIVLVFMATTSYVDYGQNRRIAELEKKLKAASHDAATAVEVPKAD